MSHALVTVVLAKGGTRTVDEAMAPFNEAIEVPPYQMACYCTQTNRVRVAGITGETPWGDRAALVMARASHFEPDADCETCGGSGWLALTVGLRPLRSRRGRTSPTAS
jgi:hypothetical protein